MNNPILVTGASGFVASRIVQQLLAKGYSVRGTVRSTNTSKIRSELGMEFRPARQSILDTMEDLTRWGHI